ncbi:hypothetical protein PENARI_c006G00423 [Penicillium arizonense]|uniref:Nucleoside phosphorylase domain-containing protein n=1 Tax=Penicillium arizonense TaxID=1835702 RepID=A0A1F5LMG3_PENAI|nr:hypothetical protein PENARI_c006G00423 [Penicillium arizonense]OGE54286.1 hypothetical protein PENARI_c006G00423 [Penicillium arizonense]
MAVVRVDHDSLQAEKHLMHETLQAYIYGKIHPLIKNRVWPRIVVCGHYSRNGPNVHISPNEKREKRFNWHRPTAVIIDDSTLEIRCFPGRDYVLHYALLIAYYLNLNSIKAPASVIEYRLPSSEDCLDLLSQSNLRFMGPVDTVILGYVNHLATNDNYPWETGTDEPNQLFAWKRSLRADGSTVAFVGSMMSLWGDIIGNAVRTMQVQNNISSVIYMGKAGSLRTQDIPNQVLVTGETSHLNNKILSWKSPLTTTLSTQHIAHLCQGTHITVPSPLVETELWLAMNKHDADWVDCEVGYLAQACQEHNTRFGYLHFISDNVAQRYLYNLATERQDAVISARKDIWDEIRRILALHLGIESLEGGVRGATL